MLSVLRSEYNVLCVCFAFVPTAWPLYARSVYILCCTSWDFCVCQYLVYAQHLCSPCTIRFVTVAYVYLNYEQESNSTYKTGVTHAFRILRWSPHYFLKATHLVPFSFARSWFLSEDGPLRVYFCGLWFPWSQACNLPTFVLSFSFRVWFRCDLVWVSISLYHVLLKRYYW